MTERVLCDECNRRPQRDRFGMCESCWYARAARPHRLFEQSFEEVCPPPRSAIHGSDDQ